MIHGSTDGRLKDKEGGQVMLTVSVVIPTLDRPNLLLRALRSVFNQTYPHLEVIVVLDRPSQETIAALRAIEDPRLRVIFNPCPVNAAAARNLGADHAKGSWIAFLDDDDEWLPGKIEKQLSFGLQRGDVLVSCLSRIVTQHSSYILPQKIYDNETRLDEYLFDRRSARAGEGFLQTSSFMMPRSLFEKVRFYEDRLHDDWDFVLRLSNEWKIRIETVPEELTILHMEEHRPSLTSRSKWRGSLVWIDQVRPMISRRSYGGFCLGVVGSKAARERVYSAFALILYRAFRYGSPSFWRISTYFSVWLLPEDTYRLLKARQKRIANPANDADIP
jgi:glycosyltransferase involved in cell wall biosynthesis